MDVNSLLKKAEAGFNKLEINEEYKKSALKNIKVWLTKPEFKEYTSQIEYLILKEKFNFLLDAFYQIIPFGTGGRRGLVGIGPNRINKWTIQTSAQGHSQYLIKNYGENAKKRGIVICYDVRVYSQKGVYNDSISNPVMNLNCKQLAIAAAEVYAANGIKVFIFDDVRSTPELSFTIRHLKCVAGDMFSASHNLPADNGKKVYDEHGGQLIPPYDQILVDEVTTNTFSIKTIDFNNALKKDLVKFIGQEIDEAFTDSIASISLSNERNLKILYSPLHGTGLTSVYPALKKLKFNVILDEKTSNLSGMFENVTFNIPNPEVIQSFDNIIPYAKKINADIILSSDPDADRIGVMANHKGKFVFLNGNEIGILLTKYGISKYAKKKLLNKNSTIIKTEVTSSLISQIAKNNNINCIGNLLVGFKYIGDEINSLEKKGKIKDFILGTEESHGYIIGNYVRDKDAACAAVWISELAAELKKEKKDLVEYLDEIYSEYGYCHNYLTEIRLLGAKGMAQISKIMNHLRENKISSFEDFIITKKIDRLKGKPQPHLSATDTSSRNVLVFNIKNNSQTQSIRVTIRPSGTEPKIKMYFEVFGNPKKIEKIKIEKEEITNIAIKLEKSVMKYCYKILNIDFPERGFLLFWQLPLDSKLKYFEIEDEIIKIKNISDEKKRKEELYKLLSFLGANPIEKINDAFKSKYKKDILDFLSIK